MYAQMHIILYYYIKYTLSSAFWMLTKVELGEGGGGMWGPVNRNK